MIAHLLICSIVYAISGCTTHIFTTDETPEDGFLVPPTRKGPSNFSRGAVMSCRMVQHMSEEE